jgi:hypothetical protein
MDHIAEFSSLGPDMAVERMSAYEVVLTQVADATELP